MIMAWEGIASKGIDMAMGWGDSLVQGAIGNFFSNRRAHNNFLLNEQAANNADMRARQQYYDMYSISAQMRELKKAGLSPSLLYGDAPGVQGANGAQGAGASGLAAMFGSGGAQGTLAQNELMQAEAKKANAEADTILGETDRGEAEIKEIIQRTNNLWIQAEWQAVQTELASIDVFLKSEYGATEANAKIENTLAYTANLQAMLRSLVAKGRIDEESAEAIIAYNRGKVIEQQAEIALKLMQARLTEANITLTNTQVQKLINDIIVDNENVKISRRGVEINEEALLAQIEQWCIENGLRERGQNIEIGKTFIETFLKSQENGIKLMDILSPQQILTKGKK